MKRLKIMSKYFLLLLIGVFTFHLSAVSVVAAETGFNIEVEYPDNQLNKNVTYFDLAIKPELEQTLHVVLTSRDRNNVVPVNLQVTNAYTTALGEVAYTPSHYRADSLQVALSDILIPEANVIQLQPLEARLVSFQLKVPAKLAQGMILGSIYATPVVEAQPNEQANNAAEFANTYAIAKGVQLNYGTLPVPEVALQQLTAGMFNRSPTFLLTLENKSATFLKDNCQVQAAIVHAESGRRTNFQSAVFSMAPQSQVDFPLALEADKLQPGHYVADVTFTVGEKVVTEKLETAIFQTMEGQPKVKALDDGNIPQWLIMLVLVMGFIIIGGLIYIIEDKRKRVK